MHDSSALSGFSYPRGDRPCGEKVEQTNEAHKNENEKVVEWESHSTGE